MNMNSIGERIKYLRQNNGMTVQDLANAIDMKKGSISCYENNKYSPSAQQIVSISKLFGVSTDWLLTGKENNDTTLLSEDEKIILNKYQMLPEREKIKLEGYIDRTLLEIEDRKALNNIYNANKSAKEETSAAYSLINESESKYVYNLGKVAAGVPITEVQTMDDLVKTPLHNHIDFALTVKGDSMEPLIKSNSIVFIKSQPVLENGEIGVISIDGEVTCKKFYEYPDKIELVSINKKYDTISIDKDQKKDVRIIGKVMI